MEIINFLFENYPGSEIFIKTDAPAWLFSSSLRNEFYYESLLLDTGVAQKNCLYTDPVKTLEKLNYLYSQQETLINNEISFIRKNKVDCIIGDIPPLSFTIAEKAGIPGYAVANFSWDWIYSEYLDEYNEFDRFIKIIKEHYSRASLLFCLPLSGDLSVFQKVVDVPFVARKSRREKSAVREQLGLPSDKKILLLTFGGFQGKEFLFKNIDLDEEFKIIIPENTGIYIDNSIIISNKEMIQKQILFEDLVMIADIVISKPGYGIVSDCIAHKTPLLYTERDGFLEAEVLTKNLNDYISAVLIPQNDLFGGKWNDYVYEALAGTASNKNDVAINGAEIIAKMIQ